MMKGFKVFNPDWTCRGMKYEVGQTYELEDKIELCQKGFHFCQKANDCFNYYDFDSNNKVAEIEALGEVESDGDKSVTNKIKIAREITWYELLTIVNTGRDNTGKGNTGNRNTGNMNTGNMNTGDWNTGNMNTGYRNTGNMNTGNRNTGNMNTGDYNSTNYSSGVFCTEEPKILIFDKPSNLTLREWWNSEARRILNYHPLTLTQWIHSDDMTDQERQANPSHETTGGYLKEFTYQEAWQNLWNRLSDREKKVVMAIPNFDAEKFEKITGIKV